jgi:hypothetical protein
LSSVENIPHIFNSCEGTKGVPLCQLLPQNIKPWQNCKIAKTLQLIEKYSKTLISDYEG